MLDRLNTIGMILDVLEENILSSAKANAVLVEIEREIKHFQSNSTTVSNILQNQISVDIKKILIRLRRIQNFNSELPRLNSFPNTQRDLVRDIADLVYDHSPNLKVASELIFHIQSFVESD